MARVLIGDEITQLAAVLRDACGTTPHPSLERALEAYHAGATVGDAYVALLRSVLEPLEIAVLDASHPSFTRAASPVMLRAAHAAPTVASAVKRRDDAIIARGYRPQVDDVPNLSLVSLNANGTKRRLTQAEALAFNPGEGSGWLSSTVLLRPALERALLPTATYVGGPGEVAYFAQVSAVAEALGLAPPLVVARWSTTIVEPRLKTLSSLNVSAEDLADPHAVDSRLAGSAFTGGGLHGPSRGHKDVDQLGQANGGLVSNRVIEGVRRSIRSAGAVGAAGVRRNGGRRS